jgi:hypothetical protein
MLVRAQFWLGRIMLLALFVLLVFFVLRRMDL